MDHLIVNLKNSWQWPDIDTLFPVKYFNNIWTKYYKGNSILDQNLIQKLHSVDLDITGVTITYKPAEHNLYSKYGAVHVDDPDRFSIAKINYILGGEDSNMIWFKENVNFKSKIHIGAGSTTHTKALSLDDLTEIYRTYFKFALVEVGTTFHGVYNPTEERTAIQCRLSTLSTRETVSFEDAKKRISSIIDFA